MKTTLTLAALLATAGCAVPTYKTMSENNGSSKELTFHLPAYPTAVGADARVQVSRGHSGQFECIANSGFTTSVYMGPAETCRFLGQATWVTQVISARCSADCDVALNGAEGLIVTARGPGAKTIEVTAELNDGTVRVDHIDLAFAAPTRIAVDCAAGTICPGRHAVFAGATFSWSAALRAAEDVVQGPLEISVAPAGIVAVDGAEVRAIAPGTAQVTYRFGTLTRTLTVRVAALDDVASGEIHGLAEALDPYRAIDADTEVVGPVYGAAYNFGMHLPVWTLKDGTTALGLARLATATGAGVQTLVDAAQSTHEHLYFKAGNPDRCAAGTFAVEVDAGKAKARRSFDLLCN